MTKGRTVPDQPQQPTILDTLHANGFSCVTTQTNTDGMLFTHVSISHRDSALSIVGMGADFEEAWLDATQNLRKQTTAMIELGNVFTDVLNSLDVE